MVRGEEGEGGKNGKKEEWRKRRRVEDGEGRREREKTAQPTVQG